MVDTILPEKTKEEIKRIRATRKIRELEAQQLAGTLENKGGANLNEITANLTWTDASGQDLLNKRSNMVRLLGDLATAVTKLITTHQYGIYHFTNAGS